MQTSGNSEPVILAVCGKGGVGKTTVSAMLVRMLAEDPSARVLAIDADPAEGLAGSLGFEAHTTLDDIRREFISRLEEGRRGPAEQVHGQLDYRITESLVERNNVAFISIGRPEGAGCYCKINSLLRDILGSLAAGFHYVVIDGEAGIEQVNRRVMEQVTHLVMVTDMSRRGWKVVTSLKHVADRSVSYHDAGLIVNRVHPGEEIEPAWLPEGVTFLGTIPEDGDLRTLDMQGTSIMHLAEGPVTSAARRSLAGLLHNESMKVL